MRELQPKAFWLLAIAVVLWAAGPAAGLEPVGRLVGGYTRDVEVRDGYAYVADWNGFLIFDVSDPTCPRLVASDLTVKPNALELRGRYAFLAPLKIFDIDDPSNPVLVGGAGRWGLGNSISVQGDYAYIAGSLRVADISDVTNPYELGWINLPEYSHGVDAEGSYAFVASYTAGLRVVDIADPAVPVEVGYLDTPGASWDVEVVGDLAYLSDGPLGLSVLDISDPTSPIQIGYEVPRGWTVGIHVSGNRAYMGDAVGGGVIMDISDPTNPCELGYFKTHAGAYKVFGLGDYAYVAESYAGLRIYDISDPAAAFEVGSYDGPGFAQAVDAEGRYAYVVEDDYDLGLSVIYVEDAEHPRTVGELATDGRASTVDYSHGFAYVVDDRDGLVIIDVSDPYAPQEAASIFGNEPSTSHWVRDVFVRDDLAYVTAGADSSLRIVDVQRPALPVEIGRLHLDVSPRAVFVDGDYAYIACGDSGLVIADVSDPWEPVGVSRFRHNCYEPTLDVCVSGRCAYLANGRCGLIIVSIWIPHFPMEVSGLEGDWYAESVTVHGNTLYLGAKNELKIIDVRDPQHPVQVDGCIFPGSSGVTTCCSGGRAFAAVDGAGLFIMEYTEPYYIRGHVRDVSGSGLPGIAVSLSGDSSAVDTTDADGSFEFSGLVGSEYMGYAVTPATTGWTFEPSARRFAGLRENRDGQDFVGAPSAGTGDVLVVGGKEGYVRPDRGETATVVVNTVASGHVSVRVYSMNGERIWSATEPALPGEEKRITWDCRSTDGNLVASGVYIVHVTGGGLDTREHVAIVR